MSHITRPPKEGGFNTYTGKVQGGFTAIIDQEVDDDFKTIYDDYNGNIDDSNIKPHSLNGDRDLVPHSVGPDSLGDIPGGNIIDLSITVNQIAVGGSVQAVNVQANEAPFNPTSAGGEELLISAPWTSRGGFQLMYGAVVGGILTGDKTAITFRLRVNNPTSGPVIRTATVTLGNIIVGDDVRWYPLGVSLLGLGSAFTGLGPGGHTLYLTSQVTTGFLPSLAGQSLYSSRQVAIYEPA